MILYYTVNTREGDVQNRPEASIGGFKSSTIVDESLNKIFQGISLSEQDSNINRYVALVLTNETGADITTGIEFYFELPTLETVNNSNFKLALTAYPTSGLQKLTNNTVKPFGITFLDVLGEVNSVSIPTLLKDQSIGIWIERSLNKTNTAQQNSNANLISIYPETLSKEESILLKINY